jgi:hypothetical protein
MRQISSDSSADSSQNSLRNNDLPSIFALPKDGNSWRIDWFGEIAFPNRLLRRKQPSVLVHLSRVLDPSFRENPVSLLSPNSTLTARQRKTWISVGTLPLLSVGDIWRDGQLELRPDYELEHFADLDVNGETAVLIKAGLNLEDKGFLLPRVEHPWHMQCTQSYCLMIDLPLDRRLIIPCVELARFYFGSSSNLLTKLFLPPLSRDALYSKPHFDKATGRLSLELAPNISGASAADIGRLHVGAAAWRAAAHIGASLLKGSVAGQGAYPQTFFPFEGKTDLVASGKWLSLGDESKSTFIVYSLRSCSYPFPFRSLRYEVCGAVPSSSDRHANTSAQRRTREPTRDRTDQHAIEYDASNNLTRHTKHIRSSVRFPDLITKSVWKNRVLAAPASTAALSRKSASSVGAAAVGDPGSERPVRPIDLQIRASQDSSFPIPDFMREIVEELKTLQDFTIQLLTDSDRDGWTIPITALANEDGELNVSLFIEMEGNRLRERRVAMFSVAQESERVTIVAVEAIPVHMKLYLPSATIDELSEVLPCVAADFILRPEPKNENAAELIRHVFGTYDATFD